VTCIGYDRHEGNEKETDHLEDLGAVLIIILKRIQKEYSWMLWARFSRLRIGTSERLLSVR
jgi:hypothetical protein